MWVKKMDGNLKEQIILMRAVIGRKIMEMDGFEIKAEGSTGDEAAKYLDLIDFLKKDISGYKLVIDDFKEGNYNDLLAKLWDVANMPDESLALYSDVYLPALPSEDREEENRAMEIKAKHAKEIRKAYIISLGRSALMHTRALDIIMSKEELVTIIGNAVLDDPELMNALDKQ
ncbi:MAG: hypothetical protein LBG62_04755 [Candidatus Methanoplasma sp.]|jgi:hypothetical protein|nr:hypothetical protein [Candidatus Methanoplasma sp.]